MKLANRLLACSALAACALRRLRRLERRGGALARALELRAALEPAHAARRRERARARAARRSGRAGRGRRARRGGAACTRWARCRRWAARRACASWATGRYRADFELDMGGTWQVEIAAKPRRAAAVARAEGSLTRRHAGPAPRGAARRRRGERRGRARRPPSIPASSASRPARLQRDRRAHARRRARRMMQPEHPRGRAASTWDETTLAGRRRCKVRGWVGELERRRGRRAGRARPGALHALQPGAVRGAAGVPARRRCAASARARAARPIAPTTWCAAARNRLRLWDVAPADLDRARARAASRSSTCRSARRRAGYVIEKNVVAGGAVEPGQRLLPHRAARPRLDRGARSTRPSSPLVSRGMPARRDAALPARAAASRARSAYVYPSVSGSTRTARVRLELANPDLALRPDMYATVQLDAPQPASAWSCRTRPCCTRASAASCSSSSATGACGRSRSRSACASGEEVEILSGLEEGQRVVVVGHLPGRRRRAGCARRWSSGERAATAAARSRADRRLRAHRGAHAAAGRGGARCGARTRCATTPLDAIPDLSDVQVIVYTEWPGRSPDLVEDQITYPISTRLLAAPGVRSVRGQSFFGVSFVYVIFEDGTDLYWARSRVLEYLSGVAGEPARGRAAGARARRDGRRLGVRVRARRPQRRASTSPSCAASRTGTCATRSQSVPGVAEVASLGGFVRQYQVQVDPNRLRALGVPLGEVIARRARVERGRRRPQRSSSRATST